MTFVTIIKTLLDDFVRYRWRDLVAVFMLVFGFWVILHSQDAMARGEAKGLIGAALIMLDPRAMLPSHPPANGNGNGGTPQSIPQAPLAGDAGGPVGTPAGWEKK